MNVELIRVVVYLKEDNVFSIIETADLKRLPITGEFFIPVGSKIAYKVEAVLHEDLQTYLVVNKSDSTYNWVAENRYKIHG